MSIGLTCHSFPKAKSDPSVPELAAFPGRPNFGAPNNGLFFSVSTLDQVSKIETCVSKNNRRCIGMMIHHKDNSVEILGQWSVKKSVISTIYSEHDGSFTALRYQMSGNGPKAFVRQISVCTDNSDKALFVPYRELRLIKTRVSSGRDILKPFVRLLIVKCRVSSGGFLSITTILKCIKRHCKIQPPGELTLEAFMLYYSSLVYGDRLSLWITRFAGIAAIYIISRIELPNSK